MKLGIAWLVLLGSTFSLLACGKDKVTQCNEVIVKYNDVVGAIKKPNGDSAHPEKVDEHAKGLEAALKDFDALKVTDKDVKAAKDELGKVYADVVANEKESAALYRQLKTSKDDAKDAKDADTFVAKASKTNAELGKKSAAFLAACNTTTVK